MSPALSQRCNGDATGNTTYFLASLIKLLLSETHSKRSKQFQIYGLLALVIRTRSEKRVVYSFILLYYIGRGNLHFYGTHAFSLVMRYSGLNLFHTRFACTNITGSLDSLLNASVAYVCNGKSRKSSEKETFTQRCSSTGGDRYKRIVRDRRKRAQNQ